MRNPFILGLAEGENFCDREKELADLLQFARNGQKCVFYSPRRYGKSSMIKQVLATLEGEGFLTAYADLFPVTSERDVVNKISAAVFKGIGRGADPRTLAEKAAGLFGRLVPHVEITPEGVVFGVKFDSTLKPEILFDDLMEGTINYVRRHGVSACIVLDEFQEIMELPEAKKIEGTLRSHIQQHTEISYFFIGSRRRILLDMFTSKSRPFYKSAFNYTCGEIAKEDFVPFIVERFRKTGKTCPESAAARIYDTARGYPYYVQKLSSLCWDMTEEICDDETVAKAYRVLLRQESSDFESTWGGLALSQKSLLKALAGEPTASPFAKAFLERYHFSVGGVQKALKHLLSRDLIEKPQGVYRLTDPIFGAWLVESG